jgi:hypothetical protein
MSMQMIAATLNAETNAGFVADPRKSREIEQAWRQHDWRQGCVPFDAKCRLADFKRALTVFGAAHRAASVAARPAASRLHPAARPVAATGAGSIAGGAARRGGHRHQGLHRSPLAGPAQPSHHRHRASRRAAGRRVRVHIALLWREPDDAVTFHLNYLLEVPDHAAARFLQRAPAADLPAALFEAASAFTSADQEDVALALVHRDTIYLSSGPGAFAADVIAGRIKDTGKRLVFARCRTWLCDAMLEVEQTPLKPAPAPDCTVAAMLLGIAREATTAAAPTLQSNSPPRLGVGVHFRGDMSRA